MSRSGPRGAGPGPAAALPGRDQLLSAVAAFFSAARAPRGASGGFGSVVQRPALWRRWFLAVASPQMWNIRMMAAAARSAVICIIVQQMGPPGPAPRPQHACVREVAPPAAGGLNLGRAHRRLLQLYIVCHEYTKCASKKSVFLINILQYVYTYIWTK